MTIRLLLITTLSFACSSGTKAPAADTTPKTAAEPVAPAEAPAPATPRLVLGDAKIVMKFKSGEGEIIIAADGTFSAKVTSTNKALENKDKTGKLTPDGELVDDRGQVHARIGEDGTVSVLHETEQRENGKLVKTDSSWSDVGTLDADGTFTSKKAGTKISVGPDGTLVGFPIKEMTFTVTAGPDQKRAAVFLVIAILSGRKTIMDVSGSVSAPAKT